MYPIVMTVLASKYDVDTKKYCYFNYTAEEEEHIMQHFPWFRDLEATFHIMGFPVQSLELDNTELSFLCALKLISGCKSLTPTTPITAAGGMEGRGDDRKM